MDWAGMPEASVNEHCESSAREDNVGTHDPPWDSERQVLSEPHAPPVQLRSQRNLWARVSTRITPHPCTDLRAGGLWIRERYEL
jgi:hypothetical protein